MSGLEDKVKPETLFLLCAFPCTEGKMHRGEITKEDFDSLENAAKKGMVVDKKKLEEIYSFAVKEMALVAKELGKPVWDNSVVEEYFFVRHNKVIDKREGPYAGAPEALCEYCKFYDAEVIKAGEKTLLVEYNNKKRNVLKDLVPDAKEGDKVKIHQSYAVIKINEKE